MAGGAGSSTSPFASPETAVAGFFLPRPPRLPRRRLFFGPAGELLRRGLRRRVLYVLGSLLALYVLALYVLALYVLALCVQSLRRCFYLRGGELLLRRLLFLLLAKAKPA